MSLIKKIFQTKSSVRFYISENGLYEAIKKYGIETLCKYKFLEQLKGTELYHDFSIWDQRVYTKKGNFLGNIVRTNELNSEIKGKPYLPFSNGNMILSLFDYESETRSFGIVDKEGKKVVNFNKYYEICPLPNAAALIGYNVKSQTPVLTINFDGEIEQQEYVNIKEFYYDENCRCFKLYYDNGSGVSIRSIFIDKDGNQGEFNCEKNTNKLN